MTPLRVAVVYAFIGAIFSLACWSIAGHRAPMTPLTHLLLTNGYEARGSYWKQEALRFADRKAAKAFLYLLKAHGGKDDWRVARIDIYRVRKRVRRERVSP